MPIENIPLAQSRLQTVLRPFVYDVPPVITPNRPPPAPPSVRIVCGIVTRITSEMVMVAGSRVLERRDKRRMLCHVRQISMYVCHTTLQITQQDISSAFGRHRATVSHACAIVEDRRDDPAFDDFVGAVERTAAAVFRFTEEGAHG